MKNEGNPKRIGSLLGLQWNLHWNTGDLELGGAKKGSTWPHSN